MLDLAYDEDSRADVDMNVVKTGDGRFIEVQGTAETSRSSRGARRAARARRQGHPRAGRRSSARSSASPQARSRSDELSCDVLLVATTNRGKMREIRADARRRACTLTVAGRSAHRRARGDGRDVRGERAAEGAPLRAGHRAAGLAEDSGLEVDALGGAPGVDVGALCRRGTPYPEKFARLYAMLDAARPPRQHGPFRCALALAYETASCSKRGRRSKARLRPNPAARTASDTTRSSSTLPKAAPWREVPTK